MSRFGLVRRGQMCYGNTQLPTWSQYFPHPTRHANRQGATLHVVTEKLRLQEAPPFCGCMADNAVCMTTTAESARLQNHNRPLLLQPFS